LQGFFFENHAGYGYPEAGYAGYPVRGGIKQNDEKEGYSSSSFFL